MIGRMGLLRMPGRLDAKYRLVHRHLSKMRIYDYLI